MHVACCMKVVVQVPAVCLMSASLRGPGGGMTMMMLENPSFSPGNTLIVNAAWSGLLVIERETKKS